jgi:hypothetical protein
MAVPVDELFVGEEMLHLVSQMVFLRPDVALLSLYLLSQQVQLVTHAAVFDLSA